MPPTNKVTYDGVGGKTAAGKTAAARYVKYNYLKKAKPRYYRVFSDTGLAAGTYKYYVIPFADNYGVKATGLAIEAMAVTI